VTPLVVLSKDQTAKCCWQRPLHDMVKMFFFCSACSGSKRWTVLSLSDGGFVALRWWFCRSQTVVEYTDILRLPTQSSSLSPVQGSFQLPPGPLYVLVDVARRLAALVLCTAAKKCVRVRYVDCIFRAHQGRVRRESQNTISAAGEWKDFTDKVQDAASHIMGEVGVARATKFRRWRVRYHRASFDESTGAALVFGRSCSWSS